MHPRRWAWLLSRAESTVLAAAVVPLPRAGAHPSVVGAILGVDVVTSSGIPTDLGAGDDEDAVVLLRRTDVRYLEGVPSVTVNTTASRASSLGVVITAYQYLALTAELYPSAVTVVAGTGLKATAA